METPLKIRNVRISAIVISLILICNELFAQVPNEKVRENLRHYVPYAQPEELLLTGDGTQWIYNSSSEKQEYGQKWNVAAYFSSKDGALDIMAYSRINPLGTDEYQEILNTLKNQFGFRLSPASDDFKDVLHTAISGNNVMMAALGTVHDAQLMIGKLQEPELVKMIGWEVQGGCWIIKMPLKSLPQKLRLEYEGIENGKNTESTIHLASDPQSYRELLPIISGIERVGDPTFGSDSGRAYCQQYYSKGQGKESIRITIGHLPVDPRSYGFRGIKTKVAGRDASLFDSGEKLCSVEVYPGSNFFVLIEAIKGSASEARRVAGLVNYKKLLLLR
jgi:hypothetical protein